MLRSEHMNRPYVDKATATLRHREYYGQFVTDQIKALVLRSFGLSTLLKSVNRDGCFNDIPLKRWDAMVHNLPASVVTQLVACGDWLSLANGVCILKEAARQIREAHESPPCV